MNSSLSSCLLGNQCMIVSNSMIYSLTTLEHNFVHYYYYYLCEFFVFKGSLTLSLHVFPELHGISFDNIQIFSILLRTKLYISTFYRVLHHLSFPTCNINYYLKKGLHLERKKMDCINTSTAKVLELTTLERLYSKCREICSFNDLFYMNYNELSCFLLT